MYGRLTNSVSTSSFAEQNIGSANPTTYDNNGNITRLQRNTTTRDYVYKTGTNVPQTVGSWSYNADPSGNLTNSTRINWGIEYDPFTMMTMRYTRVAERVELQYDGKKERVYKRYINQGGVDRRTVYLHGLSDFPIMVKDNSNNEWMYVYGPTGLVAARSNNIWYYVHKDHFACSPCFIFWRGSTKLVTTTTSQVACRYEYDPYGKIVDRYINPDLKYLFTGQELETDIDPTGLSFWNFRARPFDSEIGLFYARDPAGQTWSPYSYCGGNPVMYVDKDGRIFWLPVIIGAIIGGYSGYKIGEARGAKGWEMFGYIFGGAAIGGFSGGLGSSVGTAVGGGVLGGAVGGGTGGLVAGFGMGNLAGLSGDQLWDATWQSGLSGIIGGGISGGIHGLAGAILGGSASGAVGAALGGGNSDEILRGAFIGGLISGLSYEVQNQFRQTGDPAFDNEENRKEMWKAAKSSFEKGLEEGGWNRSKNPTDRFPTGTKSSITPTPKPSDANGIFHTHPNEGPNWVQEHSPADIRFTDNVAKVNHYVISRQNIYLYVPNHPPVTMVGSTNWYLMPYSYTSFYFGR